MTAREIACRLAGHTYEAGAIWRTLPAEESRCGEYDWHEANNEGEQQLCPECWLPQQKDVTCVYCGKRFLPTEIVLVKASDV